MIFKWSKLKIIKDLEHVRKGEKEFIDQRGKISNHELPEPINLIGLIDSKKGTVRANHYHPIQLQWENQNLVYQNFVFVYRMLLLIRLDFQTYYSHKHYRPSSKKDQDFQL